MDVHNADEAISFPFELVTLSGTTHLLYVKSRSKRVTAVKISGNRFKPCMRLSRMFPPDVDFLIAESFGRDYYMCVGRPGRITVLKFEDNPDTFKVLGQLERGETAQGYTFWNKMFVAINMREIFLYSVEDEELTYAAKIAVDRNLDLTGAKEKEDTLIIYTEGQLLKLQKWGDSFSLHYQYYPLQSGNRAYAYGHFCGMHLLHYKRRATPIIKIFKDDTFKQLWESNTRHMSFMSNFTLDIYFTQDKLLLIYIHKQTLYIKCYKNTRNARPVEIRWVPYL